MSMDLISWAFKKPGQESTTKKKRVRRNFIAPRCFNLSEWKFISMSALSTGNSHYRTSRPALQLTSCTQSRWDLNLCQTDHEFTQESSEIVLLGAPHKFVSVNA